MLSCDHAYCYIGKHYKECERKLNPHQCTCNYKNIQFNEYQTDIIEHYNTCELINAFICTCPEFIKINETDSVLLYRCSHKKCYIGSHESHCQKKLNNHLCTCEVLFENTPLLFTPLCNLFEYELDKFNPLIHHPICEFKKALECNCNAILKC